MTNFEMHQNLPCTVIIISRATKVAVKLLSKLEKLVAMIAIFTPIIRIRLCDRLRSHIKQEKKCLSEIKYIKHEQEFFIQYQNTE